MRSVAFMLGAAALAGCGTKTNVPGQSAHHVVRPVPSPKAVRASHALGALTVTSDIQAFQMVTPQSGWLLTQNTLYHLTQGGREARAVASSAIDNLVAVWTPYRVFTASAPNPHPWKIKVVIRSSANGGRSWTTLATIQASYPPMQMIMQPDGIGWLETSPGPADGNDVWAQLWHTTDGGHHWALMSRTVFPYHSKPGVLPNGGHFQFLTAAKGWLIPGRFVPVPGLPVAYQTQNAGHTWSAQSWTWPPGRTMIDLQDIPVLDVTPSGRGLVVVQWTGGQSGGWQVASLVNNHVEGWSPRLLNGRMTSTPVFATTADPHTIWMVNQHTLWSISGATRPVVNQVTAHLPFLDPAIIQFTEQGRGWAMSTNAANHPVLWTTHDSGIQWHQVT